MFRGKIFGMLLEVLSKVLNPLGQQSNNDLAGARIFVMQLETLDQDFFIGFHHGQDYPPILLTDSGVPNSLVSTLPKAMSIFAVSRYLTVLSELKKLR